MPQLVFLHGPGAGACADAFHTSLPAPRIRFTAAVRLSEVSPWHNTCGRSGATAKGEARMAR